MKRKELIITRIERILESPSAVEKREVAATTRTAVIKLNAETNHETMWDVGGCRMFKAKESDSSCMYC